MGSTAARVGTVVVAPVAAPYREPLFSALHRAPELDFSAIFQSEGQPSWDVPDGHFATEHDYPATHLRSRQFARPGRTPVVWPRGLEAALDAADPEVIVASEYGPTALRAARWAARHHRAHVILTECTPEIDAMLPGPQLALHRFMANRADGVICVSDRARQRLLNFDVPEDQITVALQSADLARIRAARVQPRPVHSRPRILCVARLVPDKNIATLMRAVCQSRLDATLDVVGEGFLARELASLAVELGVDVTFHGHQRPDALAALYADADIFALLSHYEPFGVVVREATAAGLPLLVASTVGAVGDVARAGRNALIVDPGDLSAATVALGRLLTEPALHAELSAGSVAVDAETDGHDVDAFVGAVLRAAGRVPGRPGG